MGDPVRLAGVNGGPILGDEFLNLAVRQARCRREGPDRVNDLALRRALHEPPEQRTVMQSVPSVIHVLPSRTSSPYEDGDS